jgi:ring-1,2-phenylacetyl-CoA epoxidase subunit PaaD
MVKRTESHPSAVRPIRGRARRDRTVDGALERVWEALAAVPDPEIPPCSVVDLGIVEDVRVSDEAVEVDLLPTFTGCPALDVIRVDVTTAVQAAAGGRVAVIRFVYSPPWTSDRITDQGRRALVSYGITPPSDRPDEAPSDPVVIPLDSVRAVQRSAACPFCGDDQTVLESAFGPTLCRSIYYCRSCRNPFEAFKPKALS